MTQQPKRGREQTWWILLGAAAGVIATFGLALWTWRDSGEAASEFPQWLGAWATLFGVGAAIVAGFYAARAFRLESDRESRWEQTTRSAQASRVAAWPHELVHETKTETDPEGMSHDVKIGVRGVVVRVRNASDLPIAQVRVVASAMVVGPHGRTLEVPISERRQRHMDPDTTTDVTLLAGAPDALAPLLEQLEPELRVFLQFTDVVGRSWSRRTHEGELHDGGTRAERTLYVGPRRRWHRVYDPVRIAGQRWFWQQ